MTQVSISPVQINEAKQMTQGTHEQAKELQKKITDSKEKFKREKNDTKDLINRVKDYLTGQCDCWLDISLNFPCKDPLKM
jgi:hypothetical protein